MGGLTHLMFLDDTIAYLSLEFEYAFGLGRRAPRQFSYRKLDYLMKYTLEIEIDQPSDVVGELIGDPGNRQAWQPELLGIEPVEGELGKDGSTALIKYRMGKATLEMKETVEENRLPKRFVCTYETDKVWNRVENDFEEISPDKTRWIFTSEFRCRGFLKILAILIPGMFRKQSLKYMKQFKDYAEGRRGS